MLFQGNLHKGNFVKEIFIGSFTDYKENKDKTQLLCLTEKSLELYEYSYDAELKMGFLEPLLSQDLFIHIYNGKTITDKLDNLERERLILITSCGLLVLSFDIEERLFKPVASCILNTECEEKDKLMYLRTDSESKIVIAYSNTDKIFIFKLLPKVDSSFLKENKDYSKYVLLINSMEYDLILLNPHCYITDNYIIDCDVKSDLQNKNKIVIRTFTRNSKYDFIEMYVLNDADKLNFIDSEAKKSKVLEAPFQQTKSSIRHCDENKFEKYFYKYINIKDSSFPDNLNQANYYFYSINEENFCVNKSEQEVILHSLLPNNLENSRGLVLMQNYSNLYCCHLYLEDYLIINYERELVILRDGIVLVRLANEKINMRSFLVLNYFTDNCILGLYDNQMNIVFANLNMNLLHKAYQKAVSSTSKINFNTEDKMDIIDEKIFSDAKEIKIIEAIEILKGDNPLEILNEFDNGSNYCMDSIMLNSKGNPGFDSNKILAVCGERGQSKLVQYENALKEIRLTNFSYNQIREALLAENFSKLEKIMFFNSFHETTAFYFGVENGQIKFDDLNMKDFLPNFNMDEEIEKTLDAFYLNDNRTILHFTNKRINAFSLVSEGLNDTKKLSLIETIFFKVNNYQADLKIFHSLQNYFKKFLNEDPDAKILSMKHINSSIHNCIFIVLIFSNFKVSILRADVLNGCGRIEEDSTVDFYTTVSAFDVTLSNDNLLIIFGTYDNKLEILNFDVSKKQFNVKNECLLEAENADIVAESIKIASDNQLVFVSTRIGKFAIFSLDQLNSRVNFLGSFNPKSDEIEPLCIADCHLKGNNNYDLTLYSNNNSYLLELKFSDDKKNMTSKLNKYLVEKNSNFDFLSNNKNNNSRCGSFGLKNYINFFSNVYLKTNKENEDLTQLSIYQNNNLVCISHFQKVNENSLLINKVKAYEGNALAKKIIALNDVNVCILYNETQMQSLKWKLHLINVNDFKDKVIEIETLNELKIHVMKTFEIEFNNLDYSDEENKTKYLILGGEFIQTESNNSQVKKGIFYIYKVDFVKNNYIDLNYIKKYCIADPIYDLSQLNDNIILTCNNFIYSTLIELDHFNRKIEIIPKNKQHHLNKLISCESIKNSNYLVVGDVSESFNLMEFDSKNFRFEVAAAELSLKTLYKAIPDPESRESVYLLQKTGTISKYSLDEEIYTINCNYDTKEFLNRIHFKKPNLICTSILGSLVYFKELSVDELRQKYDLEPNNILMLQDLIVKMISRRYFAEELSFERLMNSSEKIVNVCLIELFTYFFKNKQLLNYIPKDKDNSQIDLTEMEKIANMIEKLLAEKDEGLL